MRPAPAARPGRADAARRGRRALAPLVVLALGGCAAMPPPSVEESPAPASEASERGEQPAARADTSEDRATADEPVTAVSDSAPESPVAVLAPKAADAHIAERRGRLAGREELSLGRADAGYYMDVQEAQLRQQLHGRGTGIYRQGDSIVLRISGTAAFDTGSSRLNADVRPLLDTIAAVLAEYRKTLVVVNSHTDAAGDAGFNQNLSEARAVSIARHLIKRGLAPERIVAVGHGESQPVAESSAPAAGWPDRRIEIVLELILRESA